MLHLLRLLEGNFTNPAGYLLTRYSGPKYILKRYGAMSDTELFLKNDHTIDYGVETASLTTRVVSIASGLSGITGRISASETGSAIGSCSVTLAEAGSTGRYFGTIGRSTIDTDLASYIGERVFEIISDGASIQAVRELIVVDRPV